MSTERAVSEKLVIKLDVPLGDLAPVQHDALLRALGPEHYTAVDIDERVVVIDALTMRQSATLTLSLVKAGFTVEMVPR